MLTLFFFFCSCPPASIVRVCMYLCVSSGQQDRHRQRRRDSTPFFRQSVSQSGSVMCVCKKKKEQKKGAKQSKSTDRAGMTRGLAILSTVGGYAHALEPSCGMWVCHCGSTKQSLTHSSCLFLLSFFCLHLLNHSTQFQRTTNGHGKVKV